MTYVEHLTRARAMRAEDLEEHVRSLSKDDRFAALVGWLERNRESFVLAGSRQDLASDHGKLAHAQGSVHALHVLAAQLAHLLNPPASSGMPGPE